MSLKKARRIKGINKKNTRRRKPRITLAAIKNANKNRAPSSLELTIYKWLDEDGIKYTKEKAISQCHVDIFIEPDIVIEAQGCYWHACKECFPTSTRKQSTARRKDKNRYKFLEANGYEVIQIWEHEVKEDPEKIREFLRLIGKKKPNEPS